uniref:Uncharacterized protein n=1 Tax=viral metagenome TaxID=1070528 RepID=A0A6M3KUD0_9ZZZZ
MDPVTSFGWNPVNVTATGTIARTGPCIMHSVVFNGVTTVGDVLIYDGVDATGTLIATLNLRSAVSVSVQPITFLYDCKMTTGIFVTFTAFAGNLTVMWG